MFYMPKSLDKKRETKPGMQVFLLPGDAGLCVRVRTLFGVVWSLSVCVFLGVFLCVSLCVSGESFWGCGALF